MTCHGLDMKSKSERSRPTCLVHTEMLPLLGPLVRLPPQILLKGLCFLLNASEHGRVSPRLMAMLFEIDDKPWDFRVYYWWINPVSIFEDKESVLLSNLSTGWFLATGLWSEGMHEIEHVQRMLQASWVSYQYCLGACSILHCVDSTA